MPFQEVGRVIGIALMKQFGWKADLRNPNLEVMNVHFILYPMDKGAWQATEYGMAKNLDTAECLMLKFHMRKLGYKIWDASFFYICLGFNSKITCSILLVAFLLLQYNFARIGGKYPLGILFPLEWRDTRRNPWAWVPLLLSEARQSALVKSLPTHYLSQYQQEAVRALVA